MAGHLLTEYVLGDLMTGYLLTEYVLGDLMAGYLLSETGEQHYYGFRHSGLDPESPKTMNMRFACGWITWTIDFR